jgi:hypothetical protein
MAFALEEAQEGLAYLVAAPEFLFGAIRHLASDLYIGVIPRLAQR